MSDAYNKETKYPSNKKPGVYTSGSIKQLGLNVDKLEDISLGNGFLDILQQACR